VAALKSFRAFFGLTLKISFYGKFRKSESKNRSESRFCFATNNYKYLFRGTSFFIYKDLSGLSNILQVVCLWQLERRVCISRDSRGVDL